MKPFLRANTSREFPGYNLDIQDQVRADVWIRELGGFVAKGEMPKLQIVRLPNDHTHGASANKPTPFAHMADNDLALGRMVEALSKTAFWKNTGTPDTGVPPEVTSTVTIGGGGSEPWVASMVELSMIEASTIATGSSPQATSAVREAKAKGRRIPPL